MIRRISTKLLLAVLAAVVIPFVGFAIFVETQMADRLSRDVVLSSLKGLAADLSSQIDRHIEEHNIDLELWAASPTCDWAIREQDAEALHGDTADEHTMRDLQRHQFNSAVVVKQTYDLLMLVNFDGQLVASNTYDSSGAAVLPEALDTLAARNFSDEPWFDAGMRGERFGIDFHTSDLVPPRNPAPGKHPENFHIGFAAPVYSEAAREQVIGVVYALVNWTQFQNEIRLPVLKDYFQGLVGPEEYPSAYAWIWKSDADTIIAHELPQLYGEKVSGPTIDLPQLVAAARAEDWGLYPEYKFRGEWKNAAFKHCVGPEAGGFGWVVGIGIDNDDIFRAVRELQGLLLKATVIVLLLAVVWTLVIARRTTAPILALQQHVQRVASGDLDARTAMRSHDELGELAQALNGMTAEIKEQRAQLVKAEKDAAWREMARQVAHDIKNPLTPIKLSADLLKRAKDEGSPDFDRIFERTIDTITRQVDHLRDIASDFHALTGTPNAQPAVLDAAEVLDEVLELDAAWAQELGVRVSRTGPGGRVRVDPGLLRRVLLNLVSNALEALPEGGELRCDVRPVRARGADWLAIEVRDTGIGVPEEVRARLFEPYFTTRSGGTGLGLAIAKRVIEEMNGTIELVPNPEGPGTLARILLPLHRAPPDAPA